MAAVLCRVGFITKMLSQVLAEEHYLKTLGKVNTATDVRPFHLKQCSQSDTVIVEMKFSK